MGDETLLERILNGDEEPKDLPLALLQSITNDFSQDRQIGQGGFGVVYKGVLQNGIIVAVKRIDVNVHTIDDKLFRREFSSLRKINHQNVVRFLGFCSNTHQTSIKEAGSEEINLASVRERLLCFEYISNGSLDKHITDELRGLEWGTRYEIIIGICKGLRYLHEEKNIVHMDLKPANILLDDHMVPKITDFGLSRSSKYSHTLGERFGTRGYFAPEYETFGKTSFKCDIYGLGVIIMELVTGCKGASDKDNVLERWKHRECNPPMTLLQYRQVTSCIEIALRCRDQEPKDRPPICDIISILSESESTDEHTAGLAEKRKIVESAFRKGKLGSSEKAEASLVRYMGINSSARGHCSKQTEQYNLHPLQSFSHHYPTNKTYLGEESRAVDVARGAMGSLLDKLGKLVKEDYNLERSMKRDIESFSEDLAKIHKDLPKLEKLDGVKIWVDEVRELSYNIEDMVDSFLVHVDPDSSRSGFRELTHEGLKLLENDTMTHREIGDVIRDIKNQVQAVLDRQKKYNFSVNDVVADLTAKAPIDPRMAIYINKKQLVGIEARTDELIGLFEEDGDVSKQELKIVSIVGLGGLGKTTLARAVYDKLKAQYHSRAFVSVGQNPDVKKILMNILSALGNKFNDLEVWQLIDELQKLLEDKRYFIVIDDIWDSEAWGPIHSAFPENSLGSRVITTTRIHPVALATCNAESKFVYRMKPLGDEDSRTLLLRRIFGSEEDCPDTPRKEEISVDILKKCGGMPLAINSIASLLAGEPASTWDYVRKTMGAMTEGDNVENMKKILDLSYIHLPDHLKTCLLYVCMYPEDREIDKNDLLRQWVAEGFVITNGRLDAEDVAEKYFKELINMCMIQPGKIDDYSNEVLSCRVHDIILDLMRSKSSKENFIHVIDGSKDEIGEIRRVSVQYNDEEDTRISETISKGSLSHVRSVFLLCRSSLVPYFLEFKYVRVLHIEHNKDSSRNNHLDLTGISRLLLLRYLKIACIPCYETYELKLPNQIGELQQLETIDIAKARLENLPSDIVSLPWLSHLSLYRFVLPDGIDRLKSLRTLEGVCLYRSSVENIKGLSKLTNLRKLQMSASYRICESVHATTMDALYSSICKLSANLRAFTVKGGLVYIPDVPGGITGTPFPRGSHIRELDLWAFRFQRCPEWIGQLHGLYKFCIRVREVADGVSIVARLPSLAYFYLSVRVIMDEEEEEKEESVVIPGTGTGGGAFRALKHLYFDCPKASLTFEAGAMPKLENLDIWFRDDMAPQFLPVGIQHLPTGTLKQIRLNVERPDYISDEYKDKTTRRRKRLRTMLKRAFKQHHPGADIYLEGDISDVFIGVEKDDDNEDYVCVDDEEDYWEDDDEEDYYNKEKDCYNEEDEATSTDSC